MVYAFHAHSIVGNNRAPHLTLRKLKAVNDIKVLSVFLMKEPVFLQRRDAVPPPGSAITTYTRVHLP